MGTDGKGRGGWLVVYMVRSVDVSDMFVLDSTRYITTGVREHKRPIVFAKFVIPSSTFTYSSTLR
jgi:hypothetical protein